MQEKLSNVGLGSIPRSITVCLDDDLADRCKPGDDVQIQGTVIRRWGQLGKAGIYILEKIRNFSKTKIQNGETLPKLNWHLF